MTPERWRKISGLYLQVMDLPPAARSDFWEQMAEPDAALRDEVEKLLAAEEETRGLTDAVHQVADAVAQESVDRLAGRRFGAWRTVGVIGQGGMGAVYKAVRDDRQFEKEAAIKVLRTAGMDLRFALARFRHERELLAELEHPNIARLIDGGEIVTHSTGETISYIVMEFVEGKPVTQYCELLPIEAKLRIFLQVCEAVQYAHQKLIVHRDLKPGNILVTESGVPKLLDFGIAKLLDPDPGSDTEADTVTMMRMLTPDYAAPEQVSGRAVTAATDVYALGVILYELLTGQRPYRVESRDPIEIARVVNKTENVRPSIVMQGTHRKQVSGDLDNIVCKALEKEPVRRYGSVAEMSDDIRRHLAGRPVLARPDTFGYRLLKFAKRNRWALTASALVLASVTAGVTMSVYQARRAERRFEQVRRLANTFLFEFYDEVQTLPGSTRVREMLVKTALEYLDTLANESGNDRRLQFELAKAYEKVGEVQGYPSRPNLGRPVEAMESYRKSVAIQRALLDDQPGDRDVAKSLAMSLVMLAYVQERSHEVEESRRNLERAVQTWSPFYRDDSRDSDDHRLMGEPFISLGDLDLAEGKLQHALENFRKSLMYRGRAYQLKKDARLGRQVSSVLMRMGRAQARLGDLDGAVVTIKEAIRLADEVRGDRPPTGQEVGTFIAHRGNLAMVYVSWDDPSLLDRAAAMPWLDEARQAAETAMAEDLNNVFAQKMAADIYRYLADATMDRPNVAASWAQRCIDIGEKARASGADDPDIAAMSIECQLGLGRALIAGKQFAAAAKILRQGLDKLEAGGQERCPQCLGLYSMVLGDLAIATGNRVQAAEWYRKTLTELDGTKAQPEDIVPLYRRSELYHRMATIQGSEWLKKDAAMWKNWNERRPGKFSRSRLQKTERLLAATSLK